MAGHIALHGTAQTLRAQIGRTRRRRQTGPVGFGLAIRKVSDRLRGRQGAAGARRPVPQRDSVAAQ